MNKEFAQNNKENRGRQNYYGGGRYSGSPNLYTYPVHSADLVLYIDDLSWLEEHQDRLQAIRQAGPDDTIRVVINTPGGAVNIAMAYVSAFRETQAHIVVHAEGMVCSAGTILWLSGPERTVSPHTEFMFHNYQGYAYGDGANMHSQIVFWERHFKRLVQEFYGGVLTEAEITTILSGGQIWMDENEILNRVEGILFDTKNIGRMQEGKKPIMHGKAAKNSKDPHVSKVRTDGEKTVAPDTPTSAILKITLPEDNEEVGIDLMTLKAKDFDGFNVNELFEIAGCLVAMSEGLEDPVALPPEMTRQELLDTILLIGKKIKEDIFGE